MGVLLYVIISLLAAVIILLLVLVFKSGKANNNTDVSLSLNNVLSEFQRSISGEIASTRAEINRSKDLISEHTLKTVDTIKDIGTTINKIIQQQEEAKNLGQSLKDLLQAPKLRGNYGESILEELLDRVLPEGIWKKQYSIDDSSKVDAAIILKDIIIPIDAKFQRDDYNRYLEAESETDKKQYWKNHSSAVKTQIRSIASKYIKPEKGTSEFAIMFVPSEAVYYETIAHENQLGELSDIYEYALENNVVPASPNTLYAFIQVIVMGVQNVEIMKNVKKIQEALATMKKSYSMFYDRYEDIGRFIDKLSDSYRKGDKHISLYKKKLENALNMEEISEDSDSGPVLFD